MNVLVISHTYCSKINRDKWKVLAKNYDVELTVVFPKNWPDVLLSHNISDILDENLSNCEFIPLRVFNAGNEVLYGYYPQDLFKILNDIKPDIIHVEQGDNAFSYFQSILLSKLLRLKSKFVFFTWINWKVQNGFKYKLFWKWIEKICLRTASGAIVGNRDAGSILESKGFFKSFKVLPQIGVDTSFFSPAKKESEVFTYIFIGRFVREKGIFLLVDAFNKLNDNSRLLFVGDGHAKSELLNYISNKRSSDHIEVVDSVSHEKVKSFLDKSDVLILPSHDTKFWREQFGHVLIEAMASKVALIGSDAGEIPNVIGDVGIIFKQGDLESLVNAMIKVQDANIRSSLTKAAYVKVLDEYSHESIAKKTYDYWLSIL